MMHFPRVCTLALLLLSASTLFTATAEAEIRRHVIGEAGLDTDAMLKELSDLLRDDGFSVKPQRVEDVAATALDISFSHTLIEYAFFRSRDSYEITLTLFVLHEPDDRVHRALTVYVQQNYGYSGIATIPIGETGILIWNEYDNTTGQTSRQLLDTTLSLWRDEFLSSD